MLTAELIYFPGCPNAEEARAQLVKAFIEARLTPRWSEYRTDDPDLPEHAHDFGSPTILVNGRDVTGAAPADSAEVCRLYTDETGRRGGIPSLGSIVAALAEAQGAHEPIRPWRRNLALLVTASIWNTWPVRGPTGASCPACSPSGGGAVTSQGATNMEVPK